MNESPRRARKSVPRWTRTDRDWVMMVLGVVLIVFFVFSGYLALTEREDGTRGRKRGPVKDPKTSWIMEHRRIVCTKEHSARIMNLGIDERRAECAALS